MESTTKGRRGTPLSVRIAQDTHDWLTERAKASGQSVTQTVERALHAQKEQEARYMASLTSLFEFMVLAARFHPDFLGDPVVFDHVRGEWLKAIDILDPRHPVPGEKP